MTALVRAELAKLRSVTMTAWLFATTLLVVVLEVMGFVLANEDGSGPAERYDPDLLSKSVASASAGEIIVMILGILALSHELRFGTATSTFLVTPRRGQVVAAKMIAISFLGAAFAFASMLIAVPLSVWLIRLRSGIVTWDLRVVEVLIASVLVMVLYGPLGIAVGALVRNQIAAIAGSLAWLFIIEQLLTGLLPDIGRWTPGGTTGEVLQVGSFAGPNNLLPPWLAGLALVGWTIAFAVVGTRTAVRRDLT